MSVQSITLEKSADILGFTVGTLSGNVTYTLPLLDGSDSQVLTTDGSGVIAWETASGGIGAGKAIVFAMIFGN